MTFHALAALALAALAACTVLRGTPLLAAKKSGGKARGPARTNSAPRARKPRTKAAAPSGGPSRPVPARAPAGIGAPRWGFGRMGGALERYKDRAGGLGRKDLLFGARAWDSVRALVRAVHGPDDPRVWAALSRAAGFALESGEEPSAAAACAAAALDGLERAAAALASAGAGQAEVPGAPGSPSPRGGDASEPAGFAPFAGTGAAFRPDLFLRVAGTGTGAAPGRAAELPRVPWSVPGGGEAPVPAERNAQASPFELRSIGRFYPEGIDGSDCAWDSGPGEDWPVGEETGYARMTLEAAGEALLKLPGRDPSEPLPEPCASLGEAVWPVPAGGVPSTGPWERDPAVSPESLRAELAAAEGLLGPGSKEALVTRSRLGALLAGRARPGDAEADGEAKALLKEASEGLDALLGREDGDAKDAMERYAMFLAGDVKPPSAIARYGRNPTEGELLEAMELCYAVCRARIDEGSPPSDETLREPSFRTSALMAGVLLKLGRKDPAMKLVAELIPQAEAALGKLHPDTLALNSHLANLILVTEGPTDLAVSTRVTILDEIRFVYGGRAAEVLRELLVLADTLTGNGKHLASLGVMAEALEILEAPGGPPGGWEAMEIRAAMCDGFIKCRDYRSARLVIALASPPASPCPLPGAGEEIGVLCLLGLGFASFCEKDVAGGLEAFRGAVSLHGEDPPDSRSLALSLDCLG
ncbi:MAG: hypothetical protein LBQ79_14270, partial [Deltaproteobacteria bacterium]|nr:hypothetical protein [Deltaproteobacteria bacterium]